MLTIAVDAMGGDYAPKSEVEGAILAAAELNISVILVGVEDVVRKELALHPEAAYIQSSWHRGSEHFPKPSRETVSPPACQYCSNRTDRAAASLRAGAGIPHAEVKAWAESLNTDKPLPLPKSKRGT